MDIVEIAPSYDFANGLTCVAAGRLILNVLSASWSEGGAWRRASRRTSSRAQSGRQDLGIEVRLDDVDAALPYGSVIWA